MTTELNTVVFKILEDTSVETDTPTLQVKWLFSDPRIAKVIVMNKSKSRSLNIVRYESALPSCSS